MDPEFLDHLNDFMKTVLAPDALTVKKVGGREVRCKDMIHFIKSFFEVLNVRKIDFILKYYFLCKGRGDA